MKKILVVCLLAIISMGAMAQTKQGTSSFGYNLGYGFNDNGNVMMGLDYRYNLTDNVRLTPSLTYFIKNNGLSAWAIDLNAHYVFELSDMFGFYPLAGLDLSFWKAKAGGWSNNATRIGANIGLGGELYATEQLTVGVEFKYNVVKDFDQAIVGIRLGYNFW